MVAVQWVGGIVMFVRQKIRCPQCESHNCRHSRWLTAEEKTAHPGCQPYRCNDCTHRFLQPDAEKTPIRGVPWPVTAGAVVIAIAVTFIANHQSPHIDSVRAEMAASAMDPELKMAAEAGDALAQYRLGEAMLQQPGHTQETSTAAMRWLRLSAENGNTEAMIVLGRLSRTGVGILQNFGEAAKWLKVAATRGNPEGMLEYGRLFRDGIGVEKDPVHAYVWFNRASAARNLDAVRERELIIRQLSPGQLAEAQHLSSSTEEGDSHQN